MNKEQHRILSNTITDIFGECSTFVDEDMQSILVTAKSGSVLVCSTGIEVDSIAGPRMVQGWEVGLLNGDGEFVEEEETTLFWHMVTVVAELLAEQAVHEAHQVHAIETSLDDAQYE